MTFSNNNPTVKLHVYREAAEGGDLFKECSPSQEEEEEEKEGEEDDKKARHVHIVFTTRVNLEQMELQAHYLSAFNLSMLCGKLLTYADKQNRKRYYQKSVCEKCTRMFSFNQSSIQSQMKKVQKDFDGGLVDEKVSQRFLDHVAQCKYNKLTSTTMPESGTLLSFSNQKAMHHKPLSIYIDFEASHCSLSHLCTGCMTLYKSSKGSQRLVILEECRRRKHVKLRGGPKCDSCVQILEERLEDFQNQKFCPDNHYKMQFLDGDGVSVPHPFCTTCYDTLCNNPILAPECNHSRTTPNSSLEIISFCIVAVENYGPGTDKKGKKISYPRLAKEVTYVGKKGEGGDSIMKKFWETLARMRGLVASKWKGAFRRLEESPLSAAEQAEFEAATSCYGCRSGFEAPVKDVVHDSVNSLFPPSKTSGVRKVRDHCHRTGEKSYSLF